MTTKSPFQGQTVVLRPFEPDDAPALQAYLNHPDLSGRRYIPWKFSDLAPLSRKQVEEIIQKWGEEDKELHLAVVTRESGELLGHCECDWGWDPHCPSVGLVIAPEHQRRGYGSQALDMLLCYLFEHTPAHNVSLWMADWNQAARTFAARHGFQEIGGMRRSGLRGGRSFDLVVADLLRPEWQARHGGGAHGA